MNDHDWENLQFLLNADEATLRDWYGKMNTDDHQYACELMNAFSEELRERHARIDAEIIAEADETSVAKEYLKKFTLGKK